MILLVVAKAPVPGEVKTRLIPQLGAEVAADLAAAALLDTLDVVRAAGRWLDSPVVLALSGDLGRAARSRQLCRELTDLTTVPQRGTGLGHRLRHAHIDACTSVRGGRGPVLQLGMDTPQVGVSDLAAAAELLAGHGAVLGPALDGGWWLLGLHDPVDAQVLTSVPMSTPQTGARTLAALRGLGRSVATTGELRDVDHVHDLAPVAALAPEGRFAAAVLRLPRRLLDPGPALSVSGGRR